VQVAPPNVGSVYSRAPCNKAPCNKAPCNKAPVNLKTLDLNVRQRRTVRTTKRHDLGDRKIGLPAIVVFWLVAPVGAAGAILPMTLDLGWAWMTFSAIIVQVAILMTNDRRGFIKSREVRRAYEARRHFSMFETVVLFLLIMIDILVLAYAYLTVTSP